MKLEIAPVGESSRMAQIQVHFADLTIEICNMKKGKEIREKIWCTKCKTEGHDKKQCLALRNYLNTRVLSPFNNNILYCEICRVTGHNRPKDCYLLQRYVQVAKNPYCRFFKSLGHNEDERRSFNLMMERTQDAYQVQADVHGHNGYGH